MEPSASGYFEYGLDESIGCWATNYAAAILCGIFAMKLMDKHSNNKLQLIESISIKSIKSIKSQKLVFGSLYLIFIGISLLLGGLVHHFWAIPEIGKPSHAPDTPWQFSVFWRIMQMLIGIATVIIIFMIRVIYIAETKTIIYNNDNNNSNNNNNCYENNKYHKYNKYNVSTSMNMTNFTIIGLIYAIFIFIISIEDIDASYYVAIGIHTIVMFIFGIFLFFIVFLCKSANHTNNSNNNNNNKKDSSCNNNDNNRNINNNNNNNNNNKEKQIYLSKGSQIEHTFLIISSIFVVLSVLPSIVLGNVCGQPDLTFCPLYEQFNHNALGHLLFIVAIIFLFIGCFISH